MSCNNLYLLCCEVQVHLLDFSFPLFDFAPSKAIMHPAYGNSI